jgi:GTP-binding protein HflX
LADPKREELKVGNRKAVLVGVYAPSEKHHGDPLNEIRGLVETAGVKVVDSLIQMRRDPNPATLLGSGKVQELKMLVEAREAELVVFDNNLSPSQGRNLERLLDTVIVDRSEVILDIFASRAQTYEAKLQVELAQLLYFRPRLKRMWTHLERIEGGVGTGRGPGEKQLETDKRLVDRRITELKRKLREVEQHRKRMVAQRKDHQTLSLVGYTNSGKSTLLNALTGSVEYVADQLFATLDTRTRKWTVPHWGDVLLSDTVGFVRDLPHHLVASFKSTLEEARHTSLLLHVVDASHPEADQQIETVNKVLDQIGVNHSEMLLVFNKCDAVDDRSIVDVLRLSYDSAVSISAATGEGIDRLSAAVAERLGNGYLDVRIEAHAGNGKLHHFLAEHAQVTQTDYEESQAIYTCRIAQSFMKKLHEFDAQVQMIGDDHRSQDPKTTAEFEDIIVDSA